MFEAFNFMISKTNKKLIFQPIHYDLEDGLARDVDRDRAVDLARDVDRERDDRYSDTEGDVDADRDRVDRFVNLDFIGDRRGGFLASFKCVFKVSITVRNVGLIVMSPFTSYNTMLMMLQNFNDPDGKSILKKWYILNVASKALRKLLKWIRNLFITTTYWNPES